MDESPERSAEQASPNRSQMPAPRNLLQHRPIQMPRPLQFSPPLMPPMATSIPWTPRPPPRMSRYAHVTPRALPSTPRTLRPSTMFQRYRNRTADPLEREMREEGLLNNYPSMSPMYQSEGEIHGTSMQLRRTIAQMEQDSNNAWRNARRNRIFNAQVHHNNSDSVLLSELVSTQQERVPVNAPIDLSRFAELNPTGRRAYVNTMMRDMSRSHSPTEIDPAVNYGQTNAYLLWTLPHISNLRGGNNNNASYAFERHLEEPLGLRVSGNDAYIDLFRTYFNIDYLCSTVRVAMRNVNAEIVLPLPASLANRDFLPMADALPSEADVVVAQPDEASAAPAAAVEPSASAAAEPNATSTTSSALCLLNIKLEPSETAPETPMVLETAPETPMEETPTPPEELSSDDLQPSTSQSSLNSSSDSNQLDQQDIKSPVAISPDLKRRLRPRSYTQSYPISAPTKRKRRSAKANKTVAKSVLSLFDQNSTPSRAEAEVDKKDGELPAGFWSSGQKKK